MFQNVSVDFLSTALTTSLGLAAILFAVFGIFYQVYATYSVAATEGIKSPIVPKLILLCKFLVGLIALEAAASIYALARLMPCDGTAWILGGITIVSVLGMVVMTFWLAFILDGLEMGLLTPHDQQVLDGRKNFRKEYYSTWRPFWLDVAKHVYQNKKAQLPPGPPPPPPITPADL